MKKHTLVLILAAIVIAFIAFWVFGTRKAAAPTVNQTGSTSTSKPVSAVTITYQNGRFTPASATVSSGATITWVNKSESSIEIGANQHPEHTGNREITNDQFTLPVPAGSQATSKVTTVGPHSFHNHLNPSASGVITVE